MKLLTIGTLSLLVVLLATPVSAHHGGSAYDNSKATTLTGTVTDFQFIQPHPIIALDVKDDKGNVQHWVTETSSPVDMLRIGWSSNGLKTGDEITIDVMPSKNGTPVGRIRQVILSDGTVLKATSRNSI